MIWPWSACFRFVLDAKPQDLKNKSHALSACQGIDRVKLPCFLPETNLAVSRMEEWRWLAPSFCRIFLFFCLAIHSISNHEPPSQTAGLSNLYVWFAFYKIGMLYFSSSPWNCQRTPSKQNIFSNTQAVFFASILNGRKLLAHRLGVHLLWGIEKKIPAPNLLSPVCS